MLKNTLARPSVWLFLTVGLVTGCIATYCIMRFPSRQAEVWPAGGPAYNTPEVHEIVVRRAPKEVKIDGDLGEWNAPVFESACNPPYDREYRVSIRMMWDEKRLYIGGDIRTPDPMRNMSSAFGSHHFAGGSIICRLAADDTLGWPLPETMVYNPSRPPQGPLPDDDLVSFVMYYDSASSVARLSLLRRLHRPKVVDLSPDAWRGVYHEHRDGRGYTFEYAFDWSKIGIVPPKPGETRANTWNIHFSDGEGIVCTGQIAENVISSLSEKYSGVSLVNICFCPPAWGRMKFK